MLSLLMLSLMLSRLLTWELSCFLLSVTEPVIRLRFSNSSAGTGHGYFWKIIAKTCKLPNRFSC